MDSQPPPFNPYQPPAAADLEVQSPPEGALPALPWEDPVAFPEFWGRVGGMFSLVFSDPMGYFERVPRGEGLKRPWLFQLLLLAPMLLILLIVFGIMGAAGLVAALSTRGAGSVPAWIFTAILPIFLLLMPAFVFLGMVVGGLFEHFFLWVWGGLREGEPLEQTIRAHGYAHAFIGLGGMIPYLGILVQLAGLVWLGMGLARMHRTDTWRGICAILTPVVIGCCCAVLAIIVLVSGAIGASKGLHF